MIRNSIVLLLFFTSAFLTGKAQFQVRFVMESLPATAGVGAYYLAGNFNQWNPASSTHRFDTQNKPTLVLSLPAGRYEFKCTRGGWGGVETMGDGSDVGNRVLQLTTDTVVLIRIAGWKDAFVQPVRSTASPQVRLLDSAFTMPQLGNRKRTIRIYLPADYAQSTRRYPVVYMHDGQNLFDMATAPFGEWGVDECLDSLQRKGRAACILVGIDHGETSRMTEYNPYTFMQFGTGEGDQYIAFLVETLKPYIDQQFRTLPGSSHTFVAGSSMGGLISCYAALRYPSVFGGAGVFSPAFWTAPALDSMIEALPYKPQTRFFFYAGAQESEAMIPDMDRIAESIARKADNLMYSITDSEGKHNEAAWRRWLPAFFDWMFANSAP
jgi:predicted alpha/beta superfamily hydrolase